MNSGELPLNTRRKVNLAPVGAAAEYTAQTIRQPAPSKRQNRKRKVLIALYYRSAVMASIRGEAACAGLRQPFERRLFRRLSRQPQQGTTASRVSSAAAAVRIAGALAPFANDTRPPPERRPHPSAPA